MARLTGSFQGGSRVQKVVCVRLLQHINHAIIVHWSARVLDADLGQSSNQRHGSIVHLRQLDALQQWSRHREPIHAAHEGFNNEWHNTTTESGVRF